MVYFYKRTGKVPEIPADALNITFPKRLGFEKDVEEELVCDKAFLECVKVAVGPVTGKILKSIGLRL
jgi:hypothetical protein